MGTPTDFFITPRVYHYLPTRPEHTKALIHATCSWL